MPYTIGDKIKKAREHRNLTQKQLARKTGLSVVAIASIEAGRRPGPRITTIYRMARATAIKLDWFFRNLKLEIPDESDKSL